MSETILKYHTNVNPPPEGSNSYEELRLLSVNEARKMLGIRYETLKVLINKGSIGYIEIEGKIKIPYLALKDFIQRSTTHNQQQDTSSVENDIKNIITKIKLK